MSQLPPTNIIFIDPDTGVQDVYQRWLTRESLSGHVCAYPAEATHYISDHTIQHVVAFERVDQCHMEQWIRNHLIPRKIPFGFISTHGLTEDNEQCHVLSDDIRSAMAFYVSKNECLLFQQIMGHVMAVVNQPPLPHLEIPPERVAFASPASQVPRSL